MSVLELTLRRVDTADLTIIGPGSPGPYVVGVVGPRGPATGERRDSFDSAASYAPDYALHDFIDITALAEPITFGAATGTIADAARIMFRLLDDGTARALTWDASWRDGGVGLPSATVAGKLMHLGFIYHAGRSAWELVALTVEN